METIRKADGFESEKLLVLPEHVTSELAAHELTRELFVTDIGYFPRARYHYRERPGGCDTYIFIYCADGTGWVEFIGEKNFSLAKQSLIVIPAGIPHRYGASEEDPWSIYWFHLKGSHVQQILDAYRLGTDPMEIPLALFVKFVEWFDQCYDLLTTRPYSIHHHIHVCHTMRHLLSSLGLHARSPQHKKREQYLESAIGFLAERMDRSVKLSELAKHTGISIQHLIHLFKEETGVPPIDYFLRMKMQRASQLLDLTDLTVKEVAASVGIQDPYYFSRLFKKVMGSSPTVYRKVKKG